MKIKQVEPKEPVDYVATDLEGDSIPGRRVGQVIVAALEAQTGFRRFVRDALLVVRVEDRETWFVDEVLGTIECYCGVAEGDLLDVDAQSLYVGELRSEQAAYARGHRLSATRLRPCHRHSISGGKVMGSPRKPRLKFEAGDSVTWTSKSAGFTRVKTGDITHVIPPGVPPPKMGTAMHLPGRARDHESYIVRAKAEGREGARWYWPRVSGLSKAEAS